MLHRLIAGALAALMVSACTSDVEPTAAVHPSKAIAAGAPAVWEVGQKGLPAADSPSFTALVSRLACSDGVTGEVLEPSIEASTREVVVTFEVASLPPGDHTCPGNDQVPYEVDLGEPLGDRLLVDGACRHTDAASTSFCGSEAGGDQRWPRDSASTPDH